VKPTLQNIGKNHLGKFSVQNGLKLGKVLSPLRFDFAFEYVIWRVKGKEGRLKFNADGINIMGGSIDNKKRKNFYQMLVKRLLWK
jgi:hypothetical protein